MPVAAAARQPDPPGAAWFATPPARRLLREEQRQVLPVLAACYGQIGVFVRGSEHAPTELPGNMLQTLVTVTLSRGELRGDFAGRADELPFLRESVDLFYLLHAFESRAQAAPLLAEAERTLTPEGALLMVALNPLSAWRARWAPPGLRAVGATTWREWLRDAGFEIMQQRGLGPVMPFLDEDARHDLPASDVFSGVRAGYLLMARKRRPGMTPLRPRAAALPLPAGVPTA